MTILTKDIDFAARKRRMRTIVPWGDSITQSNDVSTGRVDPTTAGVCIYYGTGYADMLIRAAGRFSIVNNAGFSGQKTDAIFARYGVDVAAYNPDAVLIMMGTNNFIVGMTNAQMTAALQDVERAVMTCLSDGRLPIVVTPPPSNGNPLAARTFASFLYDLCDYYAIPLFDLHRLLVDGATGNFANGTTLSGDGIHPSDAAITLVLTQFSSLLANIENYNTPFYMDPVGNTAVNSTITNLIRNGNFWQNTTPGKPDGWVIGTTNNTQTLNAVGVGVAYPYTGNEVQEVVSAAGSLTALSGTPLAVVPGNKLRMTASVNIAGLTPSSAVGFDLRAVFGAGQVRPMSGVKQNGDFINSVDFVVPSGQTTLTPAAFINDAGTYKFRNFTLIDLTARAAIYAPGQVTL